MHKMQKQSNWVSQSWDKLAYSWLKFVFNDKNMMIQFKEKIPLLSQIYHIDVGANR